MKREGGMGLVVGKLHDRLLHQLFQTDALKVSPWDKPFWYTSGTIGPYYINTHFLYGNEKKASELLNFINNTKDSVYVFPKELLRLVRDNYYNDSIFKELMDNMLLFVKKNISIAEVDYISGGERRDWFFSFLLADLLGKPHLTIYKNLDIYEFSKNEVIQAEDLAGKNILHIADLITEASSYRRAWIPAIAKLNGNIKWSVAVVDRKQGGGEVLKECDITFYPMVEIDRDFFKRALNAGLIGSEQMKIIYGFIEDPYKSMRNFLLKYPEFLKSALKAGGKEQERANLCIETDIYKLGIR
jgi:orotate phosphoribosyltransferase